MKSARCVSSCRCVVVVALDGGFLDRPVHPLDQFRAFPRCARRVSRRRRSRRTSRRHDGARRSCGGADVVHARAGSGPRSRPTSPTATPSACASSTATQCRCRRRRKRRSPRSARKPTTSKRRRPKPRSSPRSRAAGCARSSSDRVDQRAVKSTWRSTPSSPSAWAGRFDRRLRTSDPAPSSDRRGCLARLSLSDTARRCSSGRRTRRTSLSCKAPAL